MRNKWRRTKMKFKTTNLKFSSKTGEFRSKNLKNHLSLEKIK